MVRVVKDESRSTDGIDRFTLLDKDNKVISPEVNSAQTSFAHAASGNVAHEDTMGNDGAFEDIFAPLEESEESQD